MRAFKIALLTLLVVFFAACTAGTAGKTFYVSTNGKDTYPGSKDKPWRSPAFGAKKLKPGETLIILGGRYVLGDYEKDIIRPPAGKADAWITIKGEDGKRPILAGRNNLLTGIELLGGGYIRIQNLEITSDNGSQFRDGIEALDKPVNNIVLQDLHIHHIDEFGVNLGDVNQLKIVDCKITHCGTGAVGGPAGQQGGWRNVLIKGCSLSYSGHYYQGGPGPSDYDRPDGFGIEPSAGPIEIVDTTAEHNRGDGLDSKAQNTYIHHCTIANNSCDGVKLWGTGSRLENCLIYGRGDGSSEGTPWSSLVVHTEKPNATFEIVNVTIDDAVGGNYAMHVQYDYPDTPTTLTVRNTIVSARGSNSPVFIAGGVKLTLENNLFYMPNSDLALVKGEQEYDSSSIRQLGKGTLYGDPRFVSVADYHLKDGSPAIDKGTSAGAPSTDLTHAPRPKGSAPDIGAYER
jgi:hypothetical protein